MRKILIPVLAALALWTGGRSVQAQAPAAPAASPFDQLTAGTKKADGLFTMYYKDQSLLVDINGSHLDQNFIVIASIAKGISQGQVLGGMSWGFGDDAIWSFKKVGDKIHVLHRNVRFRAT